MICYKQVSDPNIYGCVRRSDATVVPVTPTSTPSPTPRQRQSSIVPIVNSQGVIEYYTVQPLPLWVETDFPLVKHLRASTSVRSTDCGWGSRRNPWFVDPADLPRYTAIAVPSEGAICYMTTERLAPMLESGKPDYTFIHEYTHLELPDENHSGRFWDRVRENLERHNMAPLKECQIYGYGNYPDAPTCWYQ